MDSPEVVLLEAKEIPSHRNGSAIPSIDPATLLASLPAAVYTCDAEGYLISYNRALALMWGREPVLHEDRWHGSLRLRRPDGTEIPMEDCPVEMVLRTKSHGISEELVMIAPDGSRRHVITHPQALFNDAGVMTGALDMLVDISAQRQRLSSSTEKEVTGLTDLKFRTLATQAPVGIFLSAPNGDALFLNEKWCEMSGIPQSQALGNGWTAAIHPEDLPRVASMWKDAVEDQSPSHLEFRFLKPDSTITWIQGGALPLHDEKGQFNGYIGSCVDITERKNTESALASFTEESERKRRLYDGILSTTPDLAYVFNRDHKFIYVNPALLRMWGRTLEESIGKNCLELGYEPWHAALHDREIELVIATKMPIRGEVPFPHETDGVRVYDYILSPVLGADGEVEMIAGTTRDVTERKQVVDRAIFLSELSSQLATLSSEEDILRTVTETLAKKVQAQGCFFIETGKDEDSVTFHAGWNTAGIPEITRKPVLADLMGSEWWTNETLDPPIANEISPGLCGAGSASGVFRDLGIRSYASQSFTSDGRRSATLVVTCDHSRQWTDWESALIEHVLVRIWPFVERMRSETALRESQQRLLLVSDHVASLISHLDASERFRYANKRFEEWFGIDSEKLVGTPLNELLGGEMMAQRRPYIDKVLSGKPVSFEAITHHQTLGARDVHVAYDPDFGPDGEVRGFYMMSLDITERKRAEKLLERRAIHSSILWEAAGIILTAEDTDGMLQKVFGKISELLKVDAFLNFMVKADGSGLELVSSQGIPENMKAGLCHLDFGQAVCGTVAESRTPIVRQCIQSSDDPMVQLVKGFGFKAYACNPLVAGEKLLGTLSFASSTREQFEEDEIEFMETIAHYVTSAYVRHQLLDNLRVADRRKDEFLATLAHELRNPLAPIRTGLEILKMKGGQSAPDERIRSMMERQVEQLITLVNDLLDVSRITRGKLELRKSRVNLIDSVQSATEASMPEILQAGQDLRITAPDDSVFLDADPNRLTQIISNLLNNASRYSEKGATIRLEISRMESSVEIKVLDEGIGIPSNMLRPIFEMFTQVDTDGRQNGGLGIGLTLVRSLAEMHGGSVWAESPGIGLGSSFFVKLPRALDQEEMATAIQPSPETESISLRVVVVDDNRPAAETLSMAFKMLGHTVRTGFSGQEGIEIVREFQPDFVFLDLGMPGMDGCETAIQIRRTDAGKRAKLVALTGWGQDAARLRTTRSGFDHHLVKPADMGELRSLLSNHTPA